MSGNESFATASENQRYIPNQQTLAMENSFSFPTCWQIHPAFAQKKSPADCFQSHGGLQSILIPICESSPTRSFLCHGMHNIHHFFPQTVSCLLAGEQLLHRILMFSQHGIPPSPSSRSLREDKLCDVQESSQTGSDGYT